MRILRGLSELTKIPRGAAVSIGNFDGIHLGHQRILQTAKSLVDSGMASALALITFEPHPLTVLRPAEAPPRLTPPEIKASLLKSFGVDDLAILPPEPAVLGLSAEEFWNVIKTDVGASHIVEGSSFRFGKGAKGTVEKLKTWSENSSVQLHVIDSVNVPLLDGQIAPVSSSLIRFLVYHGRMRETAIALGRPYSLSGEVVHGFARGKSLGFPTANLKTDDQLIPADGVYSGRCIIDGKKYLAAISIGTLPTFNETKRQVEAHILDFNGNLYGQRLEIQVLDWLRDQKKFENLELLIGAIHHDILTTRTYEKRDMAKPIASVD